MLGLYIHHTSHRISRLLLRGGGDMGIGVQREACREVAEHARDRLDDHAVLQRQGGEGVAQIVEAGRWQPCPIQHSVE